jgi:hypothetical protein
VTNRRKPAQRPTGAEWKPGRPRHELLKAIGGASAVVLLTALVILVIKPGDSASTTPAPTGITTPNTIPTGATGSLPTDSLPTGSVPPPTQAPATTTPPTQPPASTSTPTQP